MTATTIIQPSRLRVASLPIFWFFAELVFPLIYVFGIHSATHIATPFKAFFALISIFCAVLAVRTFAQIIRIFKTNGIWRATITADRLTWEVAMPCLGLPLDIALEDIARATCLETSTTRSDSDGSYTETAVTYELHLKDGTKLPLASETAGINPHRVFCALKDRGISYSLWVQDHRSSSTDTSRVFERAY